MMGSLSGQGPTITGLILNSDSLTFNLLLLIAIKEVCTVFLGLVHRLLYVNVLIASKFLGWKLFYV